jgi:hypothetical protein
VVGEEYDVIDSQGYVGRVRVTTATEEQAGCPQFKYIRGQARWVGTPKRQWSGGDAAAIGPVSPKSRVPDKASVVYPQQTTDLPAPPDMLQQRMFLDLDGDKRPDLLRDYWMTNRSAGGQTKMWFQTMFRSSRGSTWKVVELTEVLYCY